MMSYEFAYPIVLSEQPEGGYLVSSPDFPELLTSGEDRADAVAQAVDALEEVFAARIRRGDEVPEPSVPDPVRDVEVVRLPPIMAAKAAFALGLRESGMSQAALARAVGLDEKEVRRLLDPKHPSKLASLQRVLQALHKDVELRVVEVVRPEIDRTAPRSYPEVAAHAERFAELAFPREVAAGKAIPITDLLVSRRVTDTIGRPVDVRRDESLTEEAVCEHRGGLVLLGFRPDVWDRAVAGNPRFRFTVAHEIAHAALHAGDLARHRGRAFRDTVNPTQKLPPDVPIYESPEWQANAWAGAVLMPSVAVRRSIQNLGPDAGDLIAQQLAANFQVSLQAATIRLEKLLPQLLRGTP
jgi:antitoxin HicB